MAQRPKATILEHFAELDDPRVERTRRHKLVDILAIAICATICGADSWVHIELFGRSKLAWFQSFLELPHGIPSHDTFGDVFARLDPVPSLAWTQCSCRTASSHGPRPSLNCSPGRWSLSMGRRPDGPMTGPERRGPFTGSAPGPPSRP